MTSDYSELMERFLEEHQVCVIDGILDALVGCIKRGGMTLIDWK